MKKEIKKIQDYFKSRIANGEFEVIKCDNHTISITIDGFPFILWVVSGAQFFDTFEHSLMHLAFTEEEKIECFNAVNPFYTKGVNESIQKQISELKSKMV